MGCKSIVILQSDAPHELSLASVSVSRQASPISMSCTGNTCFATMVIISVSQAPIRDSASPVESCSAPTETPVTSIDLHLGKTESSSGTTHFRRHSPTACTVLILWGANTVFAHLISRCFPLCLPSAHFVYAIVKLLIWDTAT